MICCYTLLAAQRDIPLLFPGKSSKHRTIYIQLFPLRSGLFDKVGINSRKQHKHTLFLKQINIYLMASTAIE